MLQPAHGVRPLDQTDLDVGGVAAAFAKLPVHLIEAPLGAGDPLDRLAPGPARVRGQQLRDEGRQRRRLFAGGAGRLGSGRGRQEEAADHERTDESCGIHTGCIAANPRRDAARVLFRPWQDYRLSPAALSYLFGAPGVGRPAPTCAPLSCARLDAVVRVIAGARDRRTGRVRVRERCGDGRVWRRARATKAEAPADGDDTGRLGRATAHRDGLADAEAGRAGDGNRGRAHRRGRTRRRGARRPHRRR